MSPRKARAFADLTLEYRRVIFGRILSNCVRVGECDIHNAAHGFISSNGYTRVSIHGVKQAAHRFIYQHLTGKTLRRDLEIDHTCHNRKCVRFDHMRPRTRSGNAKTRRSHGFHHQPGETQAEYLERTRERG